MIAFRCDGSSRIGSGHAMRCMALAEVLRRQGHRVAFFSRKASHALITVFKQNDFDVFELPFADDLAPETWGPDAEATLQALPVQTLEWLVVDHYGIDVRWEQKLRARSSNIVVIDDLANRPHDADILMDQNVADPGALRYKGLLSAQCRQLLGPRFALLRDEFRIAAGKAQARNRPVETILVSFGGADTDGATEQVLQAMMKLETTRFHMDVVAGPANLRAQEIRVLCQRFPDATFHHGTSKMAMLLTQADLAIGAGGISLWERCALGVPSLVYTIADNQRPGTQTAAAAGAIWDMGSSNRMDSTLLVSTLQQLLSDVDLVTKVSQKGLDLMGVQFGWPTDRVAQAMHDVPEVRLARS